MVRKSQREIERDIEAIDAEETGVIEPQIVCNCTNVFEESPHPHLTIEHREGKRKIATPNLIADSIARENDSYVMFVSTCENEGRYSPGGDSIGPTACELWAALDEADLREEREIRIEEGQPIPPVLEEYAPE
jgi:hypothetical protein